MIPLKVDFCQTRWRLWRTVLKDNRYYHRQYTYFVIPVSKGYDRVRVVDIIQAKMRVDRVYDFLWVPKKVNYENRVFTSHN